MNDVASSQHGESGPSRGELPLPDYDHLQIASLAHRIRSLNAEGLSTLLSYERQHGNRLPLISVRRTSGGLLARIEDSLVSFSIWASQSGG